jgi:DME family drug/metabolite transporter
VIEPLLNPTWAFLFLGEVPGFWAVFGGMIILSAVILRAVISTPSAPKR